MNCVTIAFYIIGTFTAISRPCIQLKKRLLSLRSTTQTKALRRIRPYATPRMFAQFSGTISTVDLIVGGILALLTLVLAAATFRFRRTPTYPTSTAVSSILLSLLGVLCHLGPLLIPEAQFEAIENGLDFAFVGLLCVTLLSLAAYTILNHPDRSRSSGASEDRLQEHLSVAIEGTSDGLWDWNIVDDTIWFSPRMKALLGFNTDEFPDQFEAWEQRLHPDDHKKTIDAIEQHLEKKKEYNITYRLKCKDDSYRWFRARGQASRSGTGRPLRMAGSIQDVNEQYQDREQVQQNKELFQAVFNRANIGIALTNSDGKFCEVNPALCKMLKYDAESLKSRSFKLVTHPEDLETFNSSYNQLEKQPSGHIELENRYIRKDGDVIYAISGVSRLKQELIGSGAQNLVHIQDITKLKRAQQKAVESSQFKSQFLAHMSHEIRTPLGGLLGMLELALGTELSDEQEHFLVTARRSSEQLMFLINDILDLSKIEAGKLEIVSSPFALRESANAMISTLSLRAHEKNLELAYHIDDAIPQTINADWSRIQQVLTNLLSNAIKFTPNGQVVLEIKLDQRAKNAPALAGRQPIALSFSVSDTGIGIPADKCREIFEAFHHADSSIPNKYGGTGLGLAISQELVALMGGRISVESEVGSGSRFSFNLQVDAQAQAHSQTSSAAARDYGGIKALIIDDNATSLEFLSRTLLSVNIQPSGFTSASAAESFLKGESNRKGKFDLCLLDSRIPGNEAFSFPSRIENHLSPNSNTVLLLSSPNRELELQRCAKHNLEHYLPKPVSSEDLLTLLDQLINPLASKESQRSEKATRVLIVEDNPINSEVALNFIKQFGHEVACVENGREAIDLLENESFDIVLMDVQMPEMSGLEATSIIRKREEETGKHQWIIALTAQAMKGDREECLAIGMDDYVTKPIKRENLQSALERAMFRKDRPSTTVSSMPANADPSSIIEAFEGEINVAKRVGQLFLETTPSLWNSLENGLANGDAKTVRTAAHRLKGSYMQFGAEDAERLALKLEEAGRNNQLEDLEESMQQLQNITRDLKKQIYQLLRH